MIRIFIGYDSREAVAFNVLSHSIQTRASEPVEIVPLMLSQLRSVFKREAHPLQSTEFSFSRFLVPHLSQYEGWSLFCDCDMLMLDDLANLWKLRDETYAVQVVKHEHNPGETKKFLNKPQSRYEKKNWSSFMLMNCKKCNELTPDYVNSATGLQLHQFKWLESDELIGDLPLEWNWLVDEPGYNTKSKVNNIHFTKGGPWFKEYANCSYSETWNQYHEECSWIER